MNSTLNYSENPVTAIRQSPIYSDCVRLAQSSALVINKLPKAQIEQPSNDGLKPVVQTPKGHNCNWPEATTVLPKALTGGSAMTPANVYNPVVIPTGGSAVTAETTEVLAMAVALSLPPASIDCPVPRDVDDFLSGRSPAYVPKAPTTKPVLQCYKNRQCHRSDCESCNKISAWHRAQNIARRKDKHLHYYHIVLTRPNPDDPDAANTLSRLFDFEFFVTAFKRLYRLTCWKTKILGGVRSIETFYMKNIHSFRSHVHVLAEVAVRLSEGDTTAIEKAWKRVGGGRISFSLIDSVDYYRNNANYVTKIPHQELLNEPEHLSEYLSLVKGRRPTETFGSFRGPLGVRLTSREHNSAPRHAETPLPTAIPTPYIAAVDVAADAEPKTSLYFRSDLASPQRQSDAVNVTCLPTTSNYELVPWDVDGPTDNGPDYELDHEPFPYDDYERCEDLSESIEPPTYAWPDSAPSAIY